MSNDKKNEKNDLFDEIKKLEEKREKLNKSIEEINDFSLKLKDKMNEEDVNIETKTYEIMMEKEKLKNENELNILSQHNTKMEKYLELLAKQYELEIKYIEQYCDYKSKVEKISEKYAHINFHDIPQLRQLFNTQLNETNNTSVNKKQIKNEPVSEPKHVNIDTPPQQTNEQVTAQRRHTISEIVKNPGVNENKNDIRQQGSLQDHLKQALSTRYKALRE